MSAFTFVLILAGILTYGIYRMAKLGVEKQDSSYTDDESRTMQEINRGLSRMEQRIEALEILLADRIERPAKTYDEVQKDNEFIVR